MFAQRANHHLHHVATVCHDKSERKGEFEAVIRVTVSQRTFRCKFQDCTWKQVPFNLQTRTPVNVCALVIVRNRFLGRKWNARSKLHRFFIKHSQELNFVYFVQFSAKLNRNFKYVILFSDILKWRSHPASSTATKPSWSNTVVSIYTNFI